jgi:ribose transport system substrate-binding protein
VRIGFSTATSPVIKNLIMRHQKSTLLSIPSLIVLAATAFLSGCGKSDSPEQPKAAADKKTKSAYVIGMSQCNLGEPWRVEMNAQIKAAADKHPNLQVIFKDAQNDTLKQRGHVEEFVSAGVDLIIISPKEAQPLTEPVAKAMAAGIPVIVLDRRLLGDKYTCFIGADNKKIGHAAGEWIKEKLGGKGKLVELKGLMTSTPGQDRDSGFREALAGSGIEIIFEADMKWLEPDSRKEMESALSRFSHIDCVYAHNDSGAHGAYLAAKAAGREKEMKFVGIDALPQEGVAYVQQGILDATFQYPTGGAEAIDNALKILKGETVPKEITLGSRVFDKDTIASGGRELK